MNETVTILYHGEQVSVPKEVADFLEQDRKRAQAEARRDKRHLSKEMLETVSSCVAIVRRPVEDEALRNLQLEGLRNAVGALDSKDQDLLDLYYHGELTMEEIGKVYGISKAAVSKRLKKLHQALRGSVI